MSTEQRRGIRSRSYQCRLEIVQVHKRRKKTQPFEIISERFEISKPQIPDQFRRVSRPRSRHQLILIENILVCPTASGCDHDE
jgi:hypothetical protein